MRGRKPVPAHIRALQTGKPVPQDRAEPPECPEWLEAEARAEWERLAPLLVERGVTALDQGLLATYCQTYARWQQAEADLSRDGLTIKGCDKQGNDFIRLNPVARHADNLAKQLKGLADKLGLNPEARHRMKQPEQTGDEMDSFLAN